MTAKAKANSQKIKNTDEAWETRELGNAEDFVVVVPEKDGPQIDDDLELQMISIRLPKSLIGDFKMIADYHGNGYQPLMRQVLKRFADSEMRIIARTVLSKENVVIDTDSVLDSKVA